MNADQKESYLRSSAFILRFQPEYRTTPKTANSPAFPTPILHRASRARTWDTNGVTDVIMSDNRLSSAFRIAILHLREVNVTPLQRLQFQTRKCDPKTK